MEKIIPFKGIRPIKSLVEKIAVFHNNLMNEPERKEEARKNPYSIAHVIKPRIDFADDVSKTDPRIFDHAKKYYWKLLLDKILVEEPEKCFYVYRQMLDGRSQTGVVACYHVDEYLNGNIKKHEHTREEKEAENVEHMMTVGINANPIFLAYNPVHEIDTLINQVKATVPEYHFVSDNNVYHSLWVLSDAELISKLKNLFNEKVSVSYIADGHHRAAASARVAKLMREANPKHRGDEPYNYLFTCLFPANQLKIYDYNRVVKEHDEISDDELFEKVKEKFEVREIKESSYSPSAFHKIGMYLGEHWFELEPKPGSFHDDPIGRLDVSILQKNILSPLLGISDPRTDKRIDFYAGIKGLSSLEKKVDKGKAAIAFSLFPVSMQQLMDVSDAGEIMPPKSTWFEPKLLSGLIIYSIR
ncbi:MAG: DUF1015 family protein [Bacteroidota bacterium]